MGHLHITIVMLDLFLMRFYQESGLEEEASSNIHLDHLILHHYIFLMGYLKNKVYASKPTTVSELKYFIGYECTQITSEIFHNVCDSIAWRCQQCLDNNGRQFENKSKKENV